MFGIATRNFLSRKDIMQFDDYIFAFDFDGTLVKTTKFINPETNDRNWKQFKLFINPDAFEINWCIVTSRPKCDKPKLIECLKRNSAVNYKGIYCQPHDIPVVHCPEEYEIKANHLINLMKCQKKRVIYVDNSKHVKLMVRKAVHDILPQNNNDILFTDTPKLFKHFMLKEFDK